MENIKPSGFMNKSRYIHFRLSFSVRLLEDKAVRLFFRVHLKPQLYTLVEGLPMYNQYFARVLFNAVHQLPFTNLQRGTDLIEAVHPI